MKAPLAEFTPDRPRRRRPNGKPFSMRHFGLRGEVTTWTGPVVRRDPATYQRPSQPLVRCRNEWCRHWMAGDRCGVCYTPRSTSSTPRSAPAVPSSPS